MCLCVMCLGGVRFIYVLCACLGGVRFTYVFMCYVLGRGEVYLYVMCYYVLERGPVRFSYVLVY
jgi:hypothetical protein